MKRARDTFGWLVIGAALALCGVAGCGSTEPRDERLELDATAWLERVERAHVTADLDPAPQANAALREALALPVPSDVSAAHRRVVHQDLLFRIARAELDAGQLEAALAAVDRGLALGQQPDVFAANLHIARGEALERLGRDAEAASAYYEALEINRKLLHHVLDAADAGPP